MSRTRKFYDVFLSYAYVDRPVAEQVRTALSHAGLAVFDFADVVAAEKVGDAVRHAIATSEAVVVVVPRREVLPATVAAEIGAAMAWNKPVYVIQPADGVGELPPFLKEFNAYPLSRVDDMASAIRKGRTPLRKRELEALSDVYAEMQTTTDRLLEEPATLDQLARRFASRTGTRVPGERLLAEMIRLHRKGLWIRLGRTG